MIVQAGASDAGRQLAAETAELVFAASGRLAEEWPGNYALELREWRAPQRLRGAAEIADWRTAARGIASVQF